MYLTCENGVQTVVRSILPVEVAEMIVGYEITQYGHCFRSLEQRILIAPDPFSRRMIDEQRFIEDLVEQIDQLLRRVRLIANQRHDGDHGRVDHDEGLFFVVH